MSGSRRSLAAAVLVLAVAAGCAGPNHATFPPIGSTPGPAGDLTDATAQQVIEALAAAGLQAAPTLRPFRPAEGPLLAGAPRSVLQVTLPDDPDHGFIVIYALADPATALAAATDTASYVVTGPGKVQFVAGSHFVLRVVGSTVIFFTWSPDNAPDTRTHLIEDALAHLGTEVPVTG
ncbi:MAG TPA: hypothetical protein VE011_06635 [Candidatus Dormibacteraeota bacterium]|nr:hypothetical protein [Candidatus Dormibacteraeota bacterium]